ncbi:hypothetical protein ODJ79_45785 [Actinoplanes sp. KI2]|uniref:hypothetical protein n=1 Tax=Actinoplanes sp. KI2 TaxID=2983315 RepID=UPI0021D5A6DB|nr:hypothetical protein [Actinoplanes sp. KI2]MCU7731070.1 hypothetical protein [Actinoplanes sp. KI2]
MRRIIYPATRAVEHAQLIPGVRPVRLFPVLWPLWQVETEAELYEGQDFEIIDHFVVRAIGEAGIRDRAQLVGFLNLPAGVIDRCLAFLGLIGHVTVAGPTLDLTPLGRQSVQDGVRYVRTTSRQTILIERESGHPFPRAHYDNNVPVLDTPRIEEGQLGDRSRFLPVSTLAPFRPEVLAWLEQHPDRAGFNLPGQLRNLSNKGEREGYLPCYLIETADHRLLAYSNVAEDRDEFLEGLFARTSLEELIEAEGIADPATLWPKWLARSPAYGAGTLRQAPDGGWRVLLDPATFGGEVKVARVGSYQFSDHHFIQIWCTDPATRRRALLERALGIATLPKITTVDQLQDRIESLARSLETTVVSLAELRAHAQEAGAEARLRRLDELERASG